jgi:predicted dehydrogenase
MAECSCEKTVRLGIIGVGGMGQGHCHSIKKVPEAKLTAVCDTDPATAEKVGKEHGVASYVKSADLIASGLCDAVIIATPHPVRPPIAVAAMKAGLHVLSEKPLCECVSGADAMIRAAKKSGLAFAVMFQRRTEPAVRKALEIIRGGGIGKLYRATMISPEYRSQAYYDSGTWRATWVGEGGGVMMNQSPHILDLFILMAGMPCQVTGNVETRLHRIEVEDLGEAMLRYPDGGTGYFYCSTNEAGPGQMIELFGDAGKLVWRNGEIKHYRFDPPIAEFTRTNTAMWGAPKAVEQPVTVEPGESGHFVIIRNFARHILTGEPLLSPGPEGLRSLELANAIWLSAYLKKPVRLPISRKAHDEFLVAMRRKHRAGARKKVAAQRTTDPQFGKA